MFLDEGSNLISTLLAFIVLRLAGMANSSENLTVNTPLLFTLMERSEGGESID